jgi:hypothetical protein
LATKHEGEVNHMAFLLAGTKEEKSAYFTAKHGGKAMGSVWPSELKADPDLMPAIAVGYAIGVFRDSGMEVEPVPFFTTFPALVEHVTRRDHAGRLVDPRECLLVSTDIVTARAVNGGPLR